MALLDAEQATKEFSDHLDSGYFSSMSEEAHKLAKMREPDEDYADHKAARDTQAVREFAQSEVFKDIVKNL